MEVEAKAVECGIIFAWEMGLKQVIVEGDSQVVIHALNRRTNTPPPPTNPANHLRCSDLAAEL